MDEIAEYIAKDSEVQAKKVVLRIIEAVERLESFPEIGEKVRRFAKQGVREIRVYRYRVFYQLKADNTVIRIVGIVHGSRRLTQEMMEQ